MHLLMWNIARGWPVEKALFAKPNSLSKPKFRDEEDL